METNQLELWNRAAERYIQDDSQLTIFHRSIYMPVIESMIGNTRDKYVLDLGCGIGEFTKKLALDGAFAFGIDGSVTMISKAYKEKQDLSAMFAVVDLTHPLPIKSRTIDIVVANMVLMDIPDIEICIREISRILRHGGVFLFSMTHPAFFCSEWECEESDPRAYKKVSDYLNETCEPVFFWGETVHYHRPLSTYFNILEKNGMCVLSLKEPVPDLNGMGEDSSTRYHMRIPSFIVLKTALLER
ncbi:class I SAM-dependent methyltransferase [uncultured Methanospirillum sp.]|uniref:class I SAM-dependent methyltransferase n=1 Tax=uncultured Methanospirillum sp. TaxID=262503 RepID=UPI0029C6C3D0|nr:class I SAM-dependent methyltransferase [uncultured Methanospirillum sp.]